jgi:hypothetical protein
MQRGEVKKGNSLSRRSDRAFRELVIKHGDTGREALAKLFQDPRPRVRSYAACYLLRYKGEEALDVLKEVAQGKGLTAFAAQQAQLRWQEGALNLDPVDE